MRGTVAAGARIVAMRVVWPLRARSLAYTARPMWFLLAALAVSFAVTTAVVRAAKLLEGVAGDVDMSGPQKFHARPVPRIGGLGILCGIATGIGVACWLEHPALPLLAGLVACGLPAFAAGLAEDVTKAQSPRRRLFFTAVSAALAVWALDATIRRTGIPGLDAAVATTAGAALVTVFVVSGVANAVNIIDGFNGLASMCALLMLAGLAYVAVSVGDATVAALSLVGIGALAGFFVWNFPAGLVFLGDGGAYFLGYYVAEVAILLLVRNPGVSPMFPLLLCFYPVFETLFSIYRKKWLRGMSPGMPDGVHLHMLIFKRLMRWAVGQGDARKITRRNSMTSPYLWLLCSLSVLPAMLFYDSTPALVLFLAVFALTYLGLYWRIVRFRAPRWLVFRGLSRRRGG
jgi:UDP-N-acetylmuramyl pentapeptide phosphotransferase/UDP-N-acetylglucosamine-1-phosphate transferase